MRAILNPRSFSAGYTLIEISIVLAVAGLLLAGGAEAWRLYRINQAESITTQNLDAVTSALDQYLVRIGKYPCPARLDLPRTDPNYGMETECDSTAAGYDAPTVGTCANGLCSQENSIVINYGPDKTPGTGDDIRDDHHKVRRGMVPFRILNLPEQQAYDGYYAKLQYAVTESLSVPSTYKDTEGSIAIVDENNAPLFDIANGKPGARYLVFSAGPDHKGAWNNQGKEILACDSTAKDGMNCNASTLATYRAGVQSTADGALYFDDILKYYSGNNAPLWKPTNAQAQHITDMLSAQNSSTGVIGIGHDPLKYSLEVTGITHAQNGLRSEFLCDDSNVANHGSNCFLQQKISIGAASPDGISPIKFPEMQCPPGQFVNNIFGGGVNGKVSCTPFAAQAVCPNGQFIKAIDANGKIVCANPSPSCPPVSADPCAGSFVQVPASDSGDPSLYPGTSVDHSSFQYSEFGFYIDDNPDALWYTAKANDLTPAVSGDYTRVEFFQCVGGQWQYRGGNEDDGGVCSACVPRDETITDQTISCNDFYYPGYGLPLYTGSVTSYRIQHFCPDNFDTLTSLSDTCICTPTDDNMQIEQCSDIYGPGFSGEGPAGYRWICPNGANGQGEFVEVPLDKDTYCTVTNCTPQPDQVTHPDCPAGFSGTQTVTSTWDCSLNGGLGGYVTTTDNSACICQGGIDGPYPAPCPEGFTGQASQQRTITCVNGAPVLGDFTVDTSSCVCNPAATQQQSVEGCQNAADQGFGPGWVGNIITTKTFNCTTLTFDVSVTNNCQQNGHTWSEGGTPSPTPQPSNPGYPMVGDTCVSGASGNCQKLQAGGFIVYPDCHCN